MKIIEILLPNTLSDKSLSPKTLHKIDLLQQRMNSYVDKILDPKTSERGREFLKSRLRDDYYELRDEIPRVHRIAENEKLVQYEIYDKRTGERIPGRGPYNSRMRATRAVDQLDNKFGAYRYGYRPIKTAISEAISKLPLTHDDFELVKKLMEKPIPAIIAPIYIHEIIEDDELNDQFSSLEDSNPGFDVRPLIAEWFKRVMPDQMYRFNGDRQSYAQKNGVLSPIHGYDSHEYHGTNDPLTGNAYGSY